MAASEGLRCFLDGQEAAGVSKEWNSAALFDLADRKSYDLRVPQASNGEPTPNGIVAQPSLDP